MEFPDVNYSYVFSLMKMNLVKSKSSLSRLRRFYKLMDEREFI